MSSLRNLWSNPAYRFGLLFLTYLAIVGFGYPPLREQFRSVGDSMSTAIAWLEHAAFDLFSDKATLSGTVIGFGGFSVEIIEECTAVYEILIFSAAVMAFPTTWKKRAIGLAFGIPVLYVINLVRIAMLLAVGHYHPSVFDFMHLYFWQATLILMITSVWLVWILKVVRDDEPATPVHT